MAKSPLSSYDNALNEIAESGLSILKPVVQETERRPSTSGNNVPQSLIPLFDQASTKYQVPVNVIMGLAQQESGFNPTAMGQQTKWGRAKGLMQYLDSTAEGMGINPYDPAQSIDAAAKQIRQRLDKGYSMEDAVKEHFAGPNRKMWGAKTTQYGIDVMRRAQNFLNGFEGSADKAPSQPQVADTAQDPYPRAKSAMEDMDIQRMRTDAEERQMFAGDLEELNKDEPGRFTIPTDEQLKAYYEGLNKDEQPKQIDVQGDAQKAEALRQSMQLPTGQEQGNKDANLLTDTGNLLWSGVNSAAENMQELIKRIPGVGPAIVDGVNRADKWLSGKTSDEIFKDTEKALDKSWSPEMLAARKKEFVTEGKDGYSFGPAWSDPRAYYSGLVESLPETALTMGVAGRLAKGAYAGMIAKGASREEAARRAATVATVAGGFIEGGMGGAASSRQVRDEINGMSREQLANSDAIKSLMVDNKMTFEDARKALAEDSATKAFFLAGIGTGIFGGMGDRALAKIITTPMMGRVKSAAKGAVAEGLLEEAPQSALQQMGENYAMQDADPSRPLSKGVANAAAQGAAVGGLMGAGMGAAAPHVSSDAPAEQAAAETPAAAPQADVVSQPVPAPAAEAQPVPKASGPLGRALETTVNQAGESGQEIRATGHWFGEPGSQQTVTAEGIDPFKATVDSYAPNGDVILRDENGDVLQVGPGEIQAAKQAAQEYVAQQEEQAPAESQQQEAEATAQEVQQPQSVPEGVDPVTGEILEPAQAAEPVPQPKTYDEMTEGELRDRLKYVATQAKGSGWDKRLTTERRKIEAAIDAKTTNLRNEQPANAEVSAPAQSDITTPVQSDEGGAAAQQPAVASSTDQPDTGSRADVPAGGAAADADPALNKDGSRKWFGTERKASEYLDKKGIAGTHEIRLEGRRFEVHAKDSATSEAAPENAPAAPAEAKPVKGRVPGGPRVNRARKLLGAEVGDTVSPQGDVGYATGGAAYKIDRIDKNGTTHITNLETGSGTTLSLADMENAHSRKVGFDRRASEAEAAEQSATSQADSQQELRDRANGRPSAAGSVAETETSAAINKPRDGVIESGEPLYSVSGRRLSPAPNFDTTGPRKLSNSQKRLNNWMYEEAVKEAEETGNDWNATLLRAIDPNRMSKSDQDTLNSLLFGDPDGPTTQNRASSRAGETVAKKETASPNPQQKTGEWQSFPEDWAPLNVPRAEMPQIKAEHRGALVNFLNARGIEHREGRVPADTLKPTQAEFSPERVERSANREGGDRSILVSSDGYVLDGHHQWLAARNDRQAVKSIILEAPIRELLNVAREFPSSTVDTSSAQATQAATPEKSADYGADNKLVSQDRAAELRKKLKAKFSQLNSGIDPEILAIGTELAVFHIEASARKFSAFAKAMASDLDMPLSRLRPYLRSWYNGARDMMEDSGINVDGMDSPETVRAELAKLDQEPTAEAATVQPAPASQSQPAAKQNPPARTDSRQTGALDDMVSQFDSEVSENVSGARSSVEQNSGNATDAVPGVQETDVTARRQDAAGTGRAGESTQPGRRARDGGEQLSDDGTTPGREPGDQRVHQPDGQFRLEGGVTGSAERGGSRSDRAAGTDVERSRAKSIADNAAKAGADLSQRLAAQRKADKSPTKWGDKGSIDAALPLLLPAQRDDVLKVEQQHAKMPGILITNGTGTGKTASGMGVAKRYANAGKDNILIAVPTDKIAADWVKFGGMMGMKVKQLDGVDDNGGTGPVITTYANLGQNDALAKRDWDLIIPDESHYLSSNEKGETTGALDKLRALSGHHAGFYDWMKSRYSKEWQAMQDAADRARAGNKDAEAQFERLSSEWDALAAPLRKQWQDRWSKQQDMTKVVFLSATPFAYVKNVDYAEGYLFNYTPPADQFSERQQGSGYNSADGQQQFFMQNFGYRMRYNKLTQPEAGVNSELMEQNFNQQLKDSGALTGRTLDVPFDYDRKFALIDDAAGRKLDAALKYLNEAENGKYRPIYEEVMRTFDYQRRMFLLESMKARAAVPMIKQHLALGRKVVVFHDYNKGGGFSPFAEALTGIKPELRATAQSLFQQPRFKIDFRDLYAAIDTMVMAFPGAMLFNGTVSKAQRRRNADLFNDDNSGRNLIVVQSDAGREGVSLHDTTGKHQRVLVNLGMPVKPVAATQIEGRIYRTGQASDAAFRYLTTGTAWEASAFASKIAERASTAENLALGNEARGLKQSFIDAYNDADVMQASKDDGKGGKEFDRSLSAGRSVSPFDRAKTFYYAQQKNSKRRDQREGADYYATPEPVGLKMVEWAGIKPGDKVLEPSAGHGAIARFFPDQTDVTMIEPSYDLSQRAALANGTAKIVNSNFEDFHITNKFDAIVMNPPYGNGGKTAIEHLDKAARHLREGGRIVALIPRGGMTDRRLAQFMESDGAKGLQTVADVSMPWSTFERAGTAVATRVLVLEKHTGAENTTTAKAVDLRDADTVEKLFDRIENVNVPPRQDLTADEAIRNARYSVSDQTSTPAFKKWFGESEVVDSEGKPLVVYHGTGSDIDSFDLDLAGTATDAGTEGRGFYFTADPDAAGSYAQSVTDWGDKPGANVVPVYLAIENPYKINKRNAPRNLEQNPKEAEKFRKNLIKQGYDGVEYTLLNGSKNYVAFYPEQIKSAVGNQGTFDPNNSDIRYSVSEVRSSVTSGELGKAAQRLIDNGQVQIHETAPEGVPRGTQGWTDEKGVIHLVADRLTPESATSVLLHEAFHAGARPLVGEARWKNLNARFERFLRAAENRNDMGIQPQNDWDRAYSRIMIAEGVGDQMNRTRAREELAAYAVENFERMPAGIRKWVQSVIGAVKEFVARRFGKQLGDVTPAQLRAMAKSALQSGRTAGRENVATSVQDNPPTPPANNEVNSWIGQKWDATKAMSDQALKTAMPTLLHWTPSRVILTRIGQDIPALKEYADTKMKMDTYRDDWHAKTDKLAQRWTKYRTKNRAENSELMALMHESTLSQVDPSEDFKSSLNNIDRAALRGDPKSDAYQDAAAKVAEDKRRQADHTAMRERFSKLSPEGQALYREVRDIYSSLANAQEQIIVDNLQKAMEYRVKEAERAFEDEMQRIRDDGLKGDEATEAVNDAKKRLENARKRDAWNRKARITKLRQEFESNRLAGPYFPLSRFGDFFVTARDKATGEVVSFSRMESAREQARIAKELKSKGHDVEEGVVSKSTELRKQVPADFVARIEDILKDMPASKETQDQVWQLYLQTMPDYSLRKNRIHRKGRAGFEEDALRAFASHMFHGAHQTARLKYAMDLGDLIDVARRQTKTTRSPVRSGLVVNQIEKNHQYVMNPTSNKISQIATQGAFMWFLAQSPASALVNMAQTFIIGVPKLAAFHGGNTAKGMAVGLAQTSKALSDITRGGFFAEKSAGLSADERKAIDTAYRIGLITRTQSHDVAGIADSGIKYTAHRAKIMAGLSWMFHHGERVNREATFLAGYRMARNKGYGHDGAIDQASNLTWDTHYDYQNTSRPAVMHSNTGKALLVFRNYTLNMLADLAYNTYSMINPRNAAERKEARTQMLGIGTMLAFNAGIRGLPLYGIAMMIAGMFSDDGEDPEVELKKTLLEYMPPSLVGMMMDGVPGYGLGIELSGRIGFGDLWFRSDDRDREGQEAYNYWLQQVLGASVAIPANWVRGVGQISQGYTWRGIESIVPKAIRDPLRAYRYATEGATTKDGDPIVDDVNGWDVFKQAIGFSPAAINEQYKLNNVNMNKQKDILGQRSRLLADYYKADKAGDEAKLEEIGKKIDEYSDKYPEMQIDNKSLRRSMKNRDRYRDSNTGGMSYNNNLRDRLIEEQPAKIYR